MSAINWTPDQPLRADATVMAMQTAFLAEYCKGTVDYFRAKRCVDALDALCAATHAATVAEYEAKLAALVGIAERITEYLSVGGLVNPEQMEHDRVRKLLLDCREAIAAARTPLPEPVQ